MAEGRRHSVDVPLSKTLVALKRVRSLRDPSTNSLRKFAAVNDNVKWEVNSWADVCIDLGKSDKDQVQRVDELLLEGDEPGGEHASRIISKGNAVSKKSSIIRIKGSRTKRAVLVRKPCQDGCKKSLRLAVALPSTNLMEEEIDSCSGTNVDDAEVIHRTVAKKKSRYGGRRKTSPAVEDVGMSRIGSPCLSESEIPTTFSSRSMSGLVNADDFVNSNYSGCGISYCWSRTPKHKDLTLSPDIECQERPLLSAEGVRRGCQDMAPMPETSRSLSQKFRPRSFNELVGLNVVTKSLMFAISRGKVAPLYLFHGPRGTGKTSTARIFAAGLNCMSIEENRPCGFCQDCVFVLSGRSRDVKELYAAKLNHKDRIKALIKNASLVSLTSQFKVYIIEECHFLQGNLWSTILNNVEELSKNAVFIMITSNPDKIPQNSMSQCQRYHFPKIKDGDIFCRLQKICIEEGFVFEKDALSFISSKANGSLQDAETMLDQLALLGKTITLSLTHELIGVVSDEELLDLLDLAFSADTINTVTRARDLMRSRIDPMQLVLQLANLIMDILSGRCQPDIADAGRKFLERHTVAQAGIQKLRHALQILSETEKQLRTSKNQATWLTVALLQFSAQESSLTNVLGSMNCSQVTFLGDHEVLDSSSATGIQKNFICYGCSNLNCPGRHCNRAKLKNIWKRTLKVFQSGTLKSFLQKEGNLSALHFSEVLGQAIATIEFYHPAHATKAERSLKSIASSFQHVLGCYVEIRIKLFSTCCRQNSEVAKLSFSLLSCSGRQQQRSESSITDEDEFEISTKKESVDKTLPSNYNRDSSPHIKQVDTNMIRDTCSFHDKEIVCGNNIEETAQNDRNKIGGQFIQVPKVCKSESNSSKAGEVPYVGIDESEIPTNCFGGVLERQKRFLSSGVSHIICLKFCSGSKLQFSMTKKAVDKAYFLTYDPCNLTPASKALITYSSGKDRMPSKHSLFRSRLLCWRAPTCSP